MLNSKAFKALAHPVRRDILKRLRNGRLSAGEIAEAYDMSKPSLSTHFAVLKQARLIQSERKGNHIYYRLNVTVADEVVSALMDVFGTQKDNHKEK
ncbi:MAG: transcriptional regulator [Robiginitomaculum sp.]|nr:MAG: transcriptional regulator [Robiginitomaculum sp.]